MALGPKAITENRAPVIKAAEERIDEAIRKATGPRVTVAAWPLKITMAEWLGLRSKYLAAGWATAEWQSDQRDGDYIDLQ